MPSRRLSSSDAVSSIAAPAIAIRRAGPLCCTGVSSERHTAGGAGTRAREKERQLAVGLVPGGYGGVGEQGARVRREQRSERGSPETGQPSQPGQPAGQVRRGCCRRECAERREDERADGQRGRRLDHAQHVQEPLGPAEVMDQEHRADTGARRGDETSDPLEGDVAGQRSPFCQHRGGTGHAAQEEVERDVGRLPGRGLDDLPAVVGLELRLGDHGAFPHRRRPRNDATPTAASALAAAPTCFQIEPRSRVVTTGSGGSP